MEVDEIQPPGCKFSRISGNGSRRLDSTKLGHTRKVDDQHNPDEEDDGEPKRHSATSVVDLGGGVGRFFGWPSSRIVRVSRASGGKDRHSKVLTSKGLRDRRVRLSVNTAIQFYDLQDRLGYDQPSKAVEWLLKAAASSIQELPPMSTVFPDTPKQLSDGKRSSTGGSDQLGFESVEVDMDGGVGDPNYQQQKVTKSSACSSPSETSKGSVLSLSRSESRIKARNRAKVRIAEKEKEKENGSSHVDCLNPISHTTSFTELLSVGLNHLNNNDHNNTTPSPNGSSVGQSANSGGGAANESHFFQKSPRQWSSAPMDYLTSGLLGHQSATRSGQMLLASPLSSVASPLYSIAADHHPELQQFSFLQDHFVSVGNTAAGGNSNTNNHDNGSNEYNLNFTISSSANSSGLAGFNRGTLQSNSSSPSLLPHLQRLPHIDGPPSFFIGTTAPVENHHQFFSGFDASARLQLYYGDSHGNNGRQSGQKGKGKN